MCTQEELIWAAIVVVRSFQADDNEKGIHTHTVQAKS